MRLVFSAALVRVALSAAAISLPAGFARAADPNVEAARWYRECMHLSDIDPQRAFERAEARRKAGGGSSAGHCAAVALVRLEKYEEGARRFEELAAAADRVGLRAALLDQAAGAWLLNGSTERAANLLAKAVEIAPDDANLRVDRAVAEAGLGHYDRAVAELDRAIALEPGLTDAYALRASARRRLGRDEAAATDIERALSLDPHHPEALLERGILRQLRGDRAGAREDWQTVVTTSPNSAAAGAARVNLDALASPR